jgi:hypothetical protein
MSGSAGGKSRLLEDWAFYYPGPVWLDGNAIKNLVLFFDGLAVLVPDYLSGKPFRSDPAIAAGLQQYGLLREVSPETFIDRGAAEQLARQLGKIIAAGALDGLDKKGSFHELSMSRLGWDVAPELAQKLFGKLEKRGLARKSEDRLSIPMRGSVRILILVLLAQILAPRGPAALNIRLSPCTDQGEIVRGLVEFLRLPSVPTAGAVINADIEMVGIDLSAVPIDEVLGFRRDNASAYRSYRRELCRFVRDLAMAGPGEELHQFDDRRREIEEDAKALVERARRAWHGPATFGLGLAGALWGVKSGDPVYGLIGAGLALAGLRASKPEAPGAFSYLFAARKRFPRR